MPQTLYNHIISVNRAETVAAASPNIGLLPYSGLGVGAGTGTFGETVILKNVPCSIQPKGMGRVKGQGLLPGDAPGPGQWHVYIPLANSVQGQIKDRDVLVDSDGYRYQVSQSSFDILGYQLVCIRLEG